MLIILHNLIVVLLFLNIFVIGSLIMLSFNRFFTKIILTLENFYIYISVKIFRFYTHFKCLYFPLPKETINMSLSLTDKKFIDMMEQKLYQSQDRFLYEGMDPTDIIIDRDDVKRLLDMVHYCHNYHALLKKKKRKLWL